MSKLSHLDEDGRAAMVDVSNKAETAREASAEARIVMAEETFALVTAGEAPKGDVLATARIAGIMGAKKTADLIPLCHPLALSHAGVTFEPLADGNGFRIVATAKTTGPTGVEMEALTAAGIAALTVYDMIKGVDRTARIETIRLLTKSGGKSGTFAADAPEAVRARSAARPAKSGRAAPRVLSHETSAPRAAPVSPQTERDALRHFMLAQRLRATDWAKSANVPVNEIYGFLNGRARTLAPATAERLARAARSSVDAMLGRKTR